MSRTVAVITHAVRDDDALVRRLRESGARVIELPCVTIEHLSDPAPLAAAVGALSREDWLVVTSPAGADAIARVAPARARVAAIGPATAARLERHGIAPTFVPSAANGVTLARELPLAAHALLARSDRALSDVPRILRERGFAVREVVAYRTRIGAAGDVSAVRDALASADEPVAIYVESPSALEGLRAAIEPELLARGVITHVAHR